jgi:hypothetical protein
VIRGRVELQPENWKAIGEVVQLEDRDRAILDEVQLRLGFDDRKFLDFLISLGKLAAATARLGGLLLPKP